MIFFVSSKNAFREEFKQVIVMEFEKKCYKLRGSIMSILFRYIVYLDIV